MENVPLNDTSVKGVGGSRYTNVGNDLDVIVRIDDRTGCGERHT
jgi:hypothetical protein